MAAEGTALLSSISRRGLVIKSLQFAACLFGLALPFGMPGALAADGAAPAARPVDKPHVLMISIDGMKPEYVTRAAEHGLNLPNLRRFLTDGTYADGVQGVVPTVTYPSHTTLVTGVWPAEHGIISNTVFDPMLEHKGEWYWYFKEVKTETLYGAADKAGLTTAAVGWPVTVGAPIDYLIAEFAQSEEIALPPTDTIRPADLKEQLAVNLPDSADGDDRKTAWTVGIIDTYNPNFVLAHLDDLDHQEHSHGPFSAEADRTIEKIDGQVGRIIHAELAKNPDATIVIVSDHGFVRVDHHVALNALLARAGLIRLAAKGGNDAAPVLGWEAQAWEAGGMAAIVLRDPNNAEVKRRVAELLAKAAADPAYGIDRVIDHDDVVKAGGFPDAAFVVDFKPGWATGGGLRGAVLTEAPGTGTHGYMPDHPELRSSFFVMGKAVARGKDLGLVDMRRIAPTVAEMLGVNLPAAKQPPLTWKKD
jgi:predicted AlkP superfamily pyrophosphatase or phosphodiesterase